jgi:cell division protein ZapE
MTEIAIIYAALVHDKKLRSDPAQDKAVRVFGALAAELDNYRPSAERSVFTRWLHPIMPPKGLYLYGDVGRGKSMLMDLFFGQVNVAKKRRVHFHQFMLEVHARLHQLNIGPEQAEGVLPRVAHDIAKEAWLLCFDEFHVGNIADAMILGRLFEALFARGVVVVATSNWPPDELYKNGLQRDRFVPFIALIKQRMNVHRMDGKIDHRYEQMRGTPCYFTPLGPDASAKLHMIFRQLTSDAMPAPLKLPVQGRVLDVANAARGVAMFTFEDLCTKPLGSADFIAIAECFSAVLIDEVPQLSPERRNESTRFTTLIDALYEAKVKLYMAAAAAPEKLCPAGDLAFAFQRTASRLVEMQSEEYRRQPHLG